MTAGHSAAHGRAVRRARQQAVGTRSAEAEGGSVEEQVLDLQRRAGNRAVADLLTSATDVQRATRPGDIGAGDLKGTRAFGEKVRSAFASDTFSKLTKALAAFQQKPDLVQAAAVVGLCDHWLAKHGSESSRKMRERKATVEQVRAEVWRDAGKLRAQSQYAKEFEGAAGTWFPLQAPSQMTKTGGHGLAKKLAAGQTGTFEGTDQAALELASKYRLTEAEIAAIRTYTMADYKYINPATASNVGWLRGNMAKAGGAFNASAGEKTLLEEGRMQAGMLKDAVTKLPAWSGTLYRGERLTAQEFKERYEGKSEYEQVAFGSASKSFSIGQKFANGMGDEAPGDKQTISVFLYFHVTSGRDVSKLSAVGSEDEVSIVGGTRFTVDKIEKLPSGPTGRKEVPAKTWYVIIMTEKPSAASRRAGSKAK
jgi:hypothetical protein